jgi:hypothetical protein
MVLVLELALLFTSCYIMPIGIDAPIPKHAVQLKYA